MAVRERKYKTTFKSTGILLGLLFKQFLGENMLYSDLAEEHYLAFRKPVFNNLEDN